MNLQSIKKVSSVPGLREGRARLEVSEQRSREITSWMQILITGPFTAITLDGPPAPPTSAPTPLASPILPVILKVMDMFHWDLAQVCQKKQIRARNSRIWT